jgi:hypothetical protein
LKEVEKHLLHLFPVENRRRKGLKLLLDGDPLFSILRLQEVQGFLKRKDVCLLQQGGLVWKRRNSTISLIRWISSSITRRSSDDIPRRKVYP